MYDPLGESAASFRWSEAALIESEQRYRQLFEHSPDPIFVEGPEGTVLDVNPAACHLHRMNREELIGMSVFDLIPESAQEEVRAAFRKWSTGELTMVEGFSVCRGERPVPVEIRGTRIEYNGSPAVLLHVRDISDRARWVEELKNAKEFSENLIRTANVLVIGIDTEGRIEVFNETAERITGHALSELQGQNVFDVLVPSDRYSDVVAEFQRVVDGGAVSKVFESPLLTKSGEERIISWQNCEIRRADGKRSFISFGIDLTDIRREEAKHRAIERKMLDAQKLESLGVLGGGIAHDFNNLLTAILGYASLARMEVPAGVPAQQYLAEIEVTSQHAAELCRQMLAFAGHGNCEVRAVDLNALIKEMKHLFQLSVSKKASLTFALAPNLPVVTGDPSQLRQVIMNLVINAAEAIGNQNGDGAIRVTTGVQSITRAQLEANPLGKGLPEGNYDFIEVVDNGCGMSAETKSKIFDPFFTTKFTGRGLGLAAVLGIITGHRGMLCIDTQEGKGTTFQILIPAAGAASEGERPGSDGETPQAGEWRGHGMALIVDDEETIRRVAARQLKSFGFEVLAARDGREGVDAFLKHRDLITVVLLDMTMPNMGGVEALREVRKACPEIPVLLASGYAKSSDLKLDGATAFIQKPFNMSALRRKLKSLLDGETPGSALGARPVPSYWTKAAAPDSRRV